MTTKWYEIQKQFAHATSKTKNKTYTVAFDWNTWKALDMNVYMFYTCIFICYYI